MHCTFTFINHLLQGKIIILIVIERKIYTRYMLEIYHTLSMKKLCATISKMYDIELKSI